ncbi:DNA cytosine methyltransferase [Thioclava sp. BHET1]|nr:DNA cytosine methyltransferase [Thioclava sp. BHET1]
MTSSSAHTSRPWRQHDMVSRPRSGLSLCAGGGGLDMGLMLAEPGFHTRCWVEWEPYPRSTIIAGQRAGYFAPAPIWDDVRTFDATPFAAEIDTLLAGYPCQGESYAGKRRLQDDPRWLWEYIADIIASLPRLEWCFFENVAGHVTGGLETVLRALRDLDFEVAAGLFTAAETGAPHERLRVLIVAHRSRLGCQWGAQFRPERSPDPRECRNDPERSGGTVEHPIGNGWKPGRETDGRDERDITGAAGQFGLADSNDARSQGLQPVIDHPQGWEEPSGYARLRGRTGLFPPGPADMDGWARVFGLAPYLAPAASFGDLASFTNQVAAMAQAGLVAEAEAQSALRRMADGLALRARALRLLGNGVHPLAAGHAWRTLSAAHGLRPLDLGAATDA